MIKKGLPQITEYHILKNKRYILTKSNDTQSPIELWSLDSGQPIQSWGKQEKYESVKSFVNENFDIGGKASAGKKADIIPQSWFTCDVKLGVCFIFASIFNYSA